MATRMLIDATHPEETRVVVVRGNRLEEFDFESANKKQLKGSIYLAKVTRVEPSLQAAFVEYGGNRHGFLAFSEIHPDYYQIPVADRQALLDEEAAAHAEEDDDDDEELPEGSAESFEEAAAHAEEDDDSGLIEVVEVDTATEVIGVGADDNGEGSDDADNGDEDPDNHRMAADADFNDPVLEGDPDTLAVVPKQDAEVAQPAPAEEGEVAQPAPVEAGEVAQPAPVEAEVASPEPLAEPSAETVEAAPVEAAPAELEQAEPEQAEAPFAPGEEAAPVDETIAPAVVPEQTRHHEEEAPPRPRFRPRRSYKIQEVIKRRQIMLVQVVKEERGNKGAALTTYLSLAGRYCVLMPNSPRGGGISRKIQNPADRKRLKSITSELELPKGMSVIVRTAGLNRTKPEIKRDYEYLLRMWDSVRELTLKSAAPALVYEEGNLIKRVIRDLYSKDIEEILVDGEDGYRQAKDFMRMLIPSHAKVVQLYKDRVPLFHRAQIETQLDQMFNPTVHLRSGGYIVINPTEALVSIDVNSGRATREHNIEETATKTNLEAAEEIARQLRLRDLAGLVVIDFIDMEDQRNARAVERKMKDCLKSDRARIQIGRISPFGLLEMSRQRLRPSLLEGSTVTCAHCRGIGLVRSTESTALHVLRGIEDEGMRERASKIAVKMPPAIALYIFNNKRDALNSLEQRYDFKIYVEIDESLIAPDYRIDRLANRTVPIPEQVVAVRSGSFPMPDLDEDVVEEEVEVDEPEIEAEAPAAEPATAKTGEQDKDGKDGGKRRRRRRRRGGRDRDGAPDGAENAKGGEDAADGDDDEGEAEGEAPATSLPSGEAVAAESDADGDDDGEGDAEGEGGTDAAATGDDDRPRRRRRGRRGGRRRRNEDGTEIAEGSTEAAAPAPDDAPAPETVPTVTTIEIVDAPVEALVAEPVSYARPLLTPDAPLFPEAVSPEVEGSDEPVSAEAMSIGHLHEEPVNKPVETITTAAEPSTVDPDAPKPAPRRGWWQRRFGN
ncbi:ribonuclease E/G [Oleomonas cavernae]|uniref:Ribonuclease E n=1 Tax=Oleomonas cavernae TaxID=2320859 RepID=A0A418WAK0_9PROT|nr:ribonuclease E/G [Oleomonas cavernae]RJF87009.1 ribonuclease E/G [Oleomonas cavernae]